MYKRNIVILFAIVIILNLIAWLSPYMGNWNFCDWYTLNVTPIWYSTFGRVSNLFPFSIGEIMIVIGIVLVLLALINLILLFFFRKNGKYLSYARKYYKFFSYVFAALCLIMTLNCSLLYHVTPLDPNPEKEKREYTISEIEILRNYIVEQCNYLAEVVSRDSDGVITYDGNMLDKSKEALWGISNEYPKLKGYYPRVKNMMFSGLMSQSYMAGYYFPFSLEANCNSRMYIMNYPNVYCHELSHLHGYVYEDEANFIAYLACVNSDDLLFQYSGYLSVLYYIDDGYFESINRDCARYNKQTVIADLVFEDNIFLTEKEWEDVNESSVIDTETMDKVSDAFTDTSLKLNGIEDGIASYSDVVGLLLQYYEGVLY